MATLSASIGTVKRFEKVGWYGASLSNQYIGYAADFGTNQYSICFEFTIPDYSGMQSGHHLNMTIGSLCSHSTNGNVYWMVSSTAPSGRSYIPDSGRMAWGWVRDKTGGANWVTSSFSTKDKTGGDSSLSFYPGRTYYLYIYADGSDNNTNYQVGGGADRFSIQLEYTETTYIGMPTGFTLSRTSCYCDQTVIMRWNAAPDGINNPVDHYEIKWAGGTDTTKSTSFTFDNKARKIKKGTKVEIRVRAIGKKGMDSDPTYIGYYNVVNKPPTAPSFSLSGSLPATGATASIKINGLSAHDADGDSIEYWGKVTNSRSEPSHGSETRFYSGSTVQMSLSKCYLHIWSWDGTYGGHTVHQADANIAPSISNISITGENVFNGSNQSCSRTVSLSASVNKGVNYQWYVFSHQTGEYKLLGTDSSYLNLNIENQVGRPGGDIRIRLKVTDSLGDTDQLDKTADFIQMPTAKKPELNSITRTESPQGTVSSYYINKNLSASVHTPSVSYSDIPLRNMEIVYKIQNDSDSTAKTLGSFYPYSGNTNTVSLSESFAYGKKFVFAARLTDNANRQTYSSWLGPYERLPRVSIKGFASNFSPTNWHVFTDKTLSITTGYSGNSTIGEPTYRVQASLNDGVYNTLFDFKKGDSGVTAGRDSLTYTSYNPKTIFEKMRARTNEPDYRVNYKIIPYNAFGEPAEESECKIITGKTVITREAPFFEGDTTLDLEVGYTNEKSPISVVHSQGKIQMPTTITPYPIPNMINWGEVVTIKINKKAIDYNEQYFNGSTWTTVQNLSGYYLQFYPSETNNRPDPDVPWKTAGRINPYTDLTSNDSGGYSANIIMPNALNNKTYVFFRLIARDNEENTSEGIYCNIPLVNCRKTSPKAVLRNIVLEDKDGIQEVRVTLNIPDYGGNDNNYENFFRNKTEKIKFHIQYGENSSDLSSSKEVEIALSEMPIDDTRNHVIGFKTDRKYAGKLYFRISFSIQTNTANTPYNEINSNVITQVYYSEGPTVAHRPHWVGINSTAYLPLSEGGKEVLQIASFKNRSIIKMTGEKDGHSIDLTIDLNEGTISGFTLDGGSW